MNRDDRAELLRLRLDRVDMKTAVARCVAWCEGPRESHTVVTANASHVCMLRRHSELRDACSAADMVLADGMSIVWALGAARRPVPERVAGIDLMAELLAAAGRRGLRVYFLGARPEVVSRLASQSERTYPGLLVAGYRHGYFSPSEHTAIVEEIRRAAPHILFIGMPSPFKETWSQRHRDRLAVPVILGVGGSFDVLAGLIARAPRAVQSIGMEWCWRLMMEPRKLWKRYLTSNTEFLWLATREILWQRLHRVSRSQRLEGWR